MFGKKQNKDIENRLNSIAKADPVNFMSLKPVVERSEERRTSYKFGVVIAQGEKNIRCVVRDLSPSGAKIVLEGALTLPQEFTLAIDGYTAPAHARLAWQNENEAGITFV